MSCVQRVLVAIDRERDLVLVEQASTLATIHHARLEIVGGIVRPWCTAYAAVDTARLERELVEVAERLLRDAVELVGDTPVCIRLVRGCAATHLARHGEQLPGDVLLFREPRRPRWPFGRSLSTAIDTAADGTLPVPA